MDKHFDFKGAQERWNRAWDARGLFTANALCEREAFVIVLPPPNVTGVLHVGHVLGDSVQDLLIRWKRMLGFNTLYVPGTDHAGIATQKVVENDLAKRGIRRADLTRESFLEHAWRWKDQHHERIVEQLKNLGCALDWSREAFTLDEARSHAVREVFVRLFDKSLIYRGNYIVNWCPSCQTAISDEEVEYVEKDAFLYHIRYPLSDGGHIVVATTRPETMLGDTAVAVSPKDADKGALVGKTVSLPLVGRRLAVIADEAVDPEFGTGFVKVTPAHDPNDFEIGERHGLDHVIVIDRDGRMTRAAGAAYEGLDRFEARKKVLADLDSQGLLERTESYRHAVGQHDRCGTVVEPLLSREWFVKMAPLAAPAIDVVERGDIDFYPPRWRNVYLSWMNNIRDWCISRQLWWGHRIPVWYCPDGHVTAAVEDPTSCATCGKADLEQDESVLDTWFSSWLWTFTPLGWPERTEDLDAFHPTSVLVTGSEIIFFWVARMIMASLEFVGEIPFRHVFLTGIVRDKQGRKMSKSLGNSPDPLDIIDRYGTDAFRFTLVMLSPPGHDIFFSEDKLETGRNFVNKIWQASRFVLSAFERDGDGVLGKPVDSTEPLTAAWNADHAKSLGFDPDLAWEDRWILSALDRCVDDVDRSFTGWRLNEAASRIYDFIWGDFCDWYLEIAKIRLYGQGDKRTVVSVLLFTLADAIRLLHPLMPYVTEELWSALPMTEGYLLNAGYPRDREAFADADADARMTLLRDLVTAARNIRAVYGVAPGERIELRVRTPNGTEGALHALRADIQHLVKAGQLEIGPNVAKDERCAASPVGEYEVIVPLAGIADVEGEVARLEKERSRLEAELRRVGSKLANDNFVSKAKAEVVEAAREKERALKNELGTIEESLRMIGGSK